MSPRYPADGPIVAALVGAAVAAVAVLVGLEVETRAPAVNPADEAPLIERPRP